MASFCRKSPGLRAAIWRMLWRTRHRSADTFQLAQLSLLEISNSRRIRLDSFTEIEFFQWKNTNECTRFQPVPNNCSDGRYYS